MSALQALTEVVQPPLQPVPVPELERADPSVFPNDYLELLGTYGQGSFDDFLSVIHPPTSPTSRNRAGDKTYWRNELEMHRYDQFVRDREIGFFEGLRPWGTTGNERLFWRTDQSDDPNLWTVVVLTPRGGYWEEFNGTLTDFLHAVMSRQYVSDTLPEDFPDEHPTFAPHDATLYPADDDRFSTPS